MLIKWKLPAGYVIVIMCSLLMQVSNITHIGFLQNYEDNISRILIAIGQGLMFLCFPLLGYLSDVRFSRYRAIKGTFVALLVGQVLAMMYLFVVAIVDFTLGVNSFTLYVNAAYLIVGLIGAVLMIVGE